MNWNLAVSTATFINRGLFLYAPHKGITPCAIDKTNASATA